MSGSSSASGSRPDESGSSSASGSRPGTGGLTFRQLRPSEAEAAIERQRLSFGKPEDAVEVEERIRDRIEQGSMWAVADDEAGVVVAQARVAAAEHWFGGRLVPCQHVGAVSVAPEHRGAGAGTLLVREALRQGAREGFGLSLLFPASTGLYRRLGFEHAGTYTRWRVDTRHVPAGGPSMRPATDGDWPAIRACHRATVAAMNGPEQRGRDAWRDLRDRTPFAYVRDAPDGGVDGYVLFDHDRRPGDWQYRIVVADWGATTSAGLQAVVGLAGRHGTIGTSVVFRAGTPNPWGLVLPEQDLERAGGLDWMARALDLPAAVAARGFPGGLSVAVDLAVEDPLLDEARGPWRLEVAGGRGKLSPSDRADVRLDARALGPLFTSYRPPVELARAGLLAGPDEALEALAAAFSGPAPTLFDMF